MYQIENNTLDTSTFPISLTQPFNERLDLNLYPIPNYSDFELKEYGMPNGIVTEFSRGCIAKCTFCEETHFWNYRQKGYLNVVDEIEHLYKNKGITAVWFVDSLVNGNLKELKLFAKELIDRKINIKWLGYARHDKRMDIEYMKLLADSGCIALNYGSESGSNKVLEEMKKRITSEEMEQNFVDGALVGIQAITGWIIGFPTETTNDFAQTLTLIWRNRETSISNILSASRFEMGPQTIVGQNPSRFGLLPMYFEKVHIRKDFTLAKPHILIRSKLWSIFLQQLKSKKEIGIQARPNLVKHYDVKYINPTVVRSPLMEDFDYNIVKLKNPFAASLVNEPFGFLRLLWRARGGYNIRVTFNPEEDKKEFGGLSCGLSGYFNFNITHDGRWEYECSFDFTQEKSPFKPFSSLMLDDAATKRARSFAKPDWGNNPIPEVEYNSIIEQVRSLNDTVDFNFTYSNKVFGDWTIKKNLL